MATDSARHSITTRMVAGKMGLTRIAMALAFLAALTAGMLAPSPTEAAAPTIKLGTVTLGRLCDRHDAAGHCEVYIESDGGNGFQVLAVTGSGFTPHGEVLLVILHGTSVVRSHLFAAGAHGRFTYKSDSLMFCAGGPLLTVRAIDEATFNFSNLASFRTCSNFDR
jgi:hypothetical protein